MTIPLNDEPLQVPEIQRAGSSEDAAGEVCLWSHGGHRAGFHLQVQSHSGMSVYVRYMENMPPLSGGGAK